MVLIGVMCVLLIMYGVVMIAALYAVLQIKTYKPDSTDSLESVSVIIAARNEERHIARCLDSILAEDFPSSMLEVIVVDDHSEDGTATIINGYLQKGVQYLKLFDDGFESITFLIGTKYDNKANYYNSQFNLA